ncbi:MAG: hypothetical protein JWR34_1948 [Mycobacterium sp.]|nr:hypothetical protein [Mycobacterium sp.]
MEPQPSSKSSRFGRVRRLNLPDTMPRASHHQERPLLVEVDVSPPDAPRETAVVAETDADHALAILATRTRDLPRLEVDAEHGAVDVRLEDLAGRAVKRGLLMLDGRDGAVTVEIDPTTRRFRRGGLPIGNYAIHAQAGVDGSGSSELRVRANEVVRHSLVLDGEQVGATTSLRLAVGDSKRVHVKAFDQDTGAAVLNDSFTVRDGFLDLRVPISRIHLELAGDDGGTNCYDADTGDDRFHLPPKVVEIKPPRLIDRPDPPNWFQRLGEQFDGGWAVFQQLGIDSLEKLADTEPEALLHQSLDRGIAIHSRIFALAVDAARALIGAAPPDALVRIPLRVGAGQAVVTSVKLQQPGEHTLDVDLRGQKGTVILEGVGPKQSFDVDGRRKLTIDVKKTHLRKRAPQLRIRVETTADDPLVGTVTAAMPKVHEIRPLQMTTRDHLNSIYSSLAERNPGISVVVNEVTLLPANIAGWVDHARAAMHSLGVCSIDDLGPLRMNPALKLHPGAYVAPARKAIGVPLEDYAFSHVINDSILRYLPNETLHDTAIVLASEWNIRGQHIVLGSDVRELLVVVHSIGYDGGSSFTWEQPALPPGPAYWPSPAPDGAPGSGAGASGHPGTDGNQDPGSNTGANAVVDAPTVTLYLRNATNGLPPIDLHGERGSQGGRGQDGGRGGDGTTGENADGTFFGGCCRGVGHGGNGGKGGKGGRGGRGGDGGRGGRITVLTTPASIIAIDAQHPAIDINPGAGGDGGAPGSPGAGGKAGAAGSADCEIWCSEHPERHGDDGAAGDSGAWGPAGNPGVDPPNDGLQFLPLTDAQWNDQFNTPHILHVQPLEVEPGDHVLLSGDHFDPGSDHVFFDGLDVGAVESATSAAFDVPLTIEGGFHPVVVGTGPTKSNKVMVKVIPKVTSLTPGRWTEGQAVSIGGLAFRAGCQVLAEDWQTTPHTTFLLPVGTVSRSQIDLKIPPAPLGNLRGVRRIRVRNPDNGLSRDEQVTRISDTIVVRVAAFRLVGSMTGTQTVRTAAEITDLFTEGTAHSISVPWSAARISFQLAQPVRDLMVDDTVANVFPHESSPHPTLDAVFTATTFVPGALNILFARDVFDATAYAKFGGGPVVFGDEPGFTITPTDLQQIVAHEFGHAMCLRHVCNGSSEGPGTFFNRDCQGSDKPFLMYPFWNESDGMILDPGEVDIARRGASYVETGKTTPLGITALYQSAVPPRCGFDDLDN